MWSVFHFKKDILQMEKERWREQNICFKKEHPGTKIKGEIKVFICDEKTRINYGPLKMKLLIKEDSMSIFQLPPFTNFTKEKFGLSSSKEIGLVHATQRPFNPQVSRRSGTNGR